MGKYINAIFYARVREFTGNEWPIHWPANPVLKTTDTREPDYARSKRSTLELAQSGRK